VAGEAQADCLFCKIVAREIPATVVRETDTTLAFRDINPQAPTHVLVVPKAHYPNAAAVAQAEPELAGQVLAEAGRVAQEEKVDESGYRLIFNTGSGAGQTVFHAHVHLLGGGDGMHERLL
jgi:histidine triad (HIT) family protein